MTDYLKRKSSEAQILDIDAGIPELEIPDKTAGGIIGGDLLKKIHEAAREMILPSWFTKLPRNFGTATLKADQWRAIATLYVPLVLIKEWPTEAQPDSKIWLDVTTDLMTAVYACTYHTVSDQSVEIYDKAITSYLTRVKQHFKKVSWVPNYHAALHITELLKQLGPSYGWWTFPFERLIRELQNVPTNSRMGESATTRYFSLIESNMNTQVSWSRRWQILFILHQD